MKTISESILQKLQLLVNQELLTFLESEEGDEGVQYFGLSEVYEDKRLVVDGVPYKVDFVLAQYKDKSASIYLKLSVDTSLNGEIVREYELVAVNGWIGVLSYLDQSNILRNYPEVETEIQGRREYKSPEYEIDRNTGEENLEIASVLKDIDNIFSKIFNTGLSS